jgi:hypothetical protein
MAFQPLSPELRQKALQIARSYNGNNKAAPMKQAAAALERQGRKGDTELVHVTPGELSLLEQIGSGTTNPVTGLREFFRGDQQSKDVEGRSSNNFGGGDDDPSGLGDLAREAEEATRGMSDGEREFAAEAAIEAMERDGSGDRDADDRAIDRLLESEMLAQTQQNIRDIQEDIDFGRAVLAEVDALAAIRAARQPAAPAVDPLVQEAVRRQSIAQAARAAAPEPKTVTEAALEQATTPIDFVTQRPAQQGIEQLAPGINVQEAVDRFTSFDPAAGAGTPALGLDPVDTRAEGLARDLSTFDRQQPDQREMIDLPGPTGRVASCVLNAIFNPTEDTRRAIAAGAQPIFADDGSGNIVGAFDEERGITYGIADERFNFRDMDENLRAAFERSRQRQEEERGRDGDDREPITEEDVIEEEEVEAPKLPPTIDIVPFRPEDFYYFTPQQRRGLPSMMNMRTR